MENTPTWSTYFFADSPISFQAGVLPDLVQQLPLFLVWLAGIGLCYTYRQRNPRAARLAMAAFFGFILVTVINTFLNDVYFPGTSVLVGSAFRRSAPMEIVNYFKQKALVIACFKAGLWGILLASVFGWKLPK